MWSAAWAMIKPYRAWLFGAIALVLFALLILGALDRYGDKRYAQGREDSDLLWREAEAKLRAQERAAAGAADTDAAIREADHAASVAEEKEKLDDAIRQGQSSFDVLFPRSGGVCVYKDGGCKPS